MEETSEEKSSSPLKQIRTFQGDIATALEKQRESLFSIREQEAAKKDGIPQAFSSEEEISKRRRQIVMLFLGSFLLIGVGGLVAWFGYQEFLRRSAPPVIITPESRFIPANSSSSLNLGETSREVVLEQINKSLAGTASNELRHIILDTKEILRWYNKA